MPLIAMNKIQFSLKKKIILKNLSFSIKKGEKIGILGLNGSGKSTLLKLCAGLLQPECGDISLLGKNLNAYSNRARARHIAYLSQSEKIMPFLTVKDIVALGRLPYRKIFFHQDKNDDFKIYSALKKVSMENFCNHKWYQLSGGQQQRVFLARSLAQASDLLIFDEPTNHLDIYQQFSFLSFLKSQPISVLLSLHDLNHAAQFCDKILLLKKNNLYEFGSIDKILTSKNIYEVFNIHCSIYKKSQKNLSISFHFSEQ